MLTTTPYPIPSAAFWQPLTLSPHHPGNYPVRLPSLPPLFLHWDGEGWTHLSPATGNVLSADASTALALIFSSQDEREHGRWFPLPWLDRGVERQGAALDSRPPLELAALALAADVERLMEDSEGVSELRHGGQRDALTQWSALDDLGLLNGLGDVRTAYGVRADAPAPSWPPTIGSRWRALGHGTREWTLCSAVSETRTVGLRTDDGLAPLLSWQGEIRLAAGWFYAVPS